MGKASSNKKVARAAKAGGSRARAAGERNILFPAALAAVVIVGTVLVVYARENRSAEALEPPLAFDDHWHAAYGIYVCDQFLPDLPEFTAPQNGGNHTHGDGLFHIHPFSSSRTGQNATLGNWFSDAGEMLGNDGGLDDDALHVPGGETYEEGESECEGLDGDPIVQVAVWDTYQAAADGEEPAIVTQSLDAIRFAKDGQAFTIAFAPEDADIPPPPSAADVAGASPDLGVPDEEIPDEAEQPNAEDPEAEQPDAGDDATSTTTADEETTSTTSADADDDQ